jgi:hypothetical protein
MKKYLNQIKLYLIIFIFILPAVYSLLKPGYFPIHDDIQAFRLLELDKCIKDGQIPCRWIPDMGYGYGYPQFNYYNPLPYYVMEIFHLIGFGFLDSTKIGFILSILISAYGMYLLGKSLWGKAGGLISSAFYIYGPYRAVNIYVRGAMGETWGIAFLPFIFWSIKEVVENKKYSKLWLALSLAALLTSHNIISIIFIPFFVAWIVFLIFSAKHRSSLKMHLKNIFISGLWGFSISAFFTLPAFFEREYVHIETLLMGYFNFLAHFVGIRQLLFSTEFGYGDSQLGPIDGLMLSPGILHWAFPILTILLLFFFKRKKYLRYSVLFLLLGWFGLFLIHPRSTIIWQSLPMLSFVQFPWRFLSIVTFCFSVISGAIVVIFPKKKIIRSLLVGLIVLIVILLNVAYFKPKSSLNITDAEKFSGDAWQKQLTISIFDYLPIYAEHPPTQKAPDTPSFLEGSGEVVQSDKGTDWQTWEISIISQSSKVIFPIYDFPIWTARVNGQKYSITHDNELGLITLFLNKGINRVELELRDTPIRKSSNLLTLISMILIPVYMIRSKSA